jgi:hypothetical protein
MDDAPIPADVNRLLAAVPFHEIRIPNETTNQCKERIRLYLLEKFRSSSGSVRAEGNIDDKTKILIIAMKDSDEHNSLINVPDDTLKPTTDSPTPTFFNYDPVAIKKSVDERSLIVRYIPLYFRRAESDLRSYFRHYGLIDSIKIHIPNGSQFQQATVSFMDAKSIAPFISDKWSILVGETFLRTFPKTFTKEQQKFREFYTLILRNLPQHTKGGDLLNIAGEVKAKHVSIPLHRRSHAPKTWAYFSFATELQLVAARDIVRSLKGNKLIWDSVSNVKNLCVRCSSPSHKPDDCDAFSSRRDKPLPQYIIDNYKRFGHNPKFLSRDNNQRSSNNNQRTFNPNSFSPTSSLRSRISYAEAVSSLNNSIHAPSNSKTGQQSPISSDKGKSVPATNFNSLQDQISSVAKVLKDTISSFDRMNIKIKK